MNTELVPFSQDFIDKVKQFKSDWHEAYTKIGAEPTPVMDGEGREIVRQRPDGKDYIIEAYMRKCLDKYFPGWSWEMAAPLHFLGAEWVVAQGHLVILDEHMIAFGITPVRKFYGVDSVRIQFKRDAPHLPENIIDVGDNCKQADSAALKYAINRLCNIGDDVYGKRIEEQGAGDTDSIMFSQASDSPLAKQMLDKYIKDKGILVSKICTELGIGKMSEITDYKAAFEKLKSIHG